MFTTSGKLTTLICMGAITLNIIGCVNRTPSTDIDGVDVNAIGDNAWNFRYQQIVEETTREHEAEILRLGTLGQLPEGFDKDASIAAHLENTRGERVREADYARQINEHSAQQDMDRQVRDAENRRGGHLSGTIIANLAATVLAGKLVSFVNNNALWILNSKGRDDEYIKSLVEGRKFKELKKIIRVSSGYSTGREEELEEILKAAEWEFAEEQRQKELGAIHGKSVSKISKLVKKEFKNTNFDAVELVALDFARTGSKESEQKLLAISDEWMTTFNGSDFGLRDQVERIKNERETKLGPSGIEEQVSVDVIKNHVQVRSNG